MHSASAATIFLLSIRPAAVVPVQSWAPRPRKIYGQQVSILPLVLRVPCVVMQQVTSKSSHSAGADCVKSFCAFTFRIFSYYYLL